jgi:HD-GYP domain-containing protein (c-di-GMP phosphodiesterase class II)
MAKFKLSILQTLILLLIFVIILFLSLTTYIITNTSKKYLIDAELELQLTILNDVSSRIYNYLTLNKTKLNDLASSIRLVGVDSADKFSVFIKDVSESKSMESLLADEQWLNVMFIDKNAHGIIAGNNIPDAGIQQLTQNAFYLSIKGNQYMSDPYILSSDKNKVLPVLIIGTPIFNEKNESIGALIITLSMKPILDFVITKSSSMEGGRRIFVVDDKNFLFLDRDVESILQHKILNDNPLVMEFKSKGSRISNIKTYEVETANGKVEMLGSYQGVPEYNWGVFAQIKKSVALQGIEEMNKKALKWAIILGIVAILLGVVIARHTSKPIQALANFALSVARERNFEKKISLKAPTEIEQLATTFNLMTDEIKNYILSLKEAAEENRQLFRNSIKMLVTAIDAKDPYTKGHSERVMYYSSIIARYLNLTKEEIDKVEIAALLHDVGKIGIDDSILRKPGILTPEEFEIMKTHPEKGAKIMSQIPQLKDMLAGMHYHHECWDGSGYPRKLKGEAIPLIARIIGLADTFDAMTTERPYQEAMEPQEALQRIIQFANSRFDPKVVKAFVSAFQHGEFNAILKSQKHHAKEKENIARA